MRIFYLFFPTILCMKKKICLIVFILLIIIVASLFLPKQQNDALAFHVFRFHRADTAAWRSPEPAQWPPAFCRDLLANLSAVGTCT